LSQICFCSELTNFQNFISAGIVRMGISIVTHVIRRVTIYFNLKFHSNAPHPFVTRASSGFKFGGVDYITCFVACQVNRPKVQ